MADALTELTRASGHDRHLKLARVFIRDWFVQPLAAGDDHIANLHANTHVAQAVGIANFAKLTGDPQATSASENFWNLVTSTRSFAIGGNSFKEWFDKANVEAGPCIDEGRILPYNTAETCNTHNMLKLTRRLIEREPQAEKRAPLGDYFERALYNHILSSVDPASGRVTYFHPLYGDLKPISKASNAVTAAASKTPPATARESISVMINPYTSTSTSRRSSNGRKMPSSSSKRETFRGRIRSPSPSCGLRSR